MSFKIKQQYVDYEKGEYINEMDCDLLQATSILKDYPWDSQRTIFPPHITGPSITLQNESEDFLKICPYFNDGFIAYYLRKKGKLQDKRIVDMQSVLIEVEKFFANNLEGYTAEIHNWHNPISHFITKDFTYRVSSLKIALFALPPVFILANYSFTVIVVLAQSHFSLNAIEKIVLIISSLFAIPLFLFTLHPLVSFYKHDKKVSVMLSQGMDIFSYYNNGENRILNKQHIQEIRYCRNRGIRQGLSYFSVFIIIFKEGKSLEISSLILSEEQMKRKMLHVNSRDVNMFYPTFNKTVFDLINIF